MRKCLIFLAGFAFACATKPPAQPAAALPHGLTTTEEAQVLRLEDRREFDPQLAAAWIAHPNPIQRARMALALGRIGPITFADANGNGQRDAGEHQAGVDLLSPLVNDPDPRVRETAALALGEIGDPAGTDALIRFAHDSDGSVAGEATEALSKLAKDVTLARYRDLTDASQRPGVRIRAVRFLFRFDSDEASAIAAGLLDTPDPALRETAAYALSRRAFAPARGALELLLSDPTFGTRAYAAAALGRIGDKESIGPLLDALRDLHPWVRTNSLVAIGRIVAKDSSAIDRANAAQDALRVVDMTDDPDPGTRASSIDVLGDYAKRSDIAKKRLAEIVTRGSRCDRELAVGAWAKQFGDAHPQTSWEKVRDEEGRFDPSLARDSDPMVRAAVLGNIPDDAIEANIEIIRAGVADPDVIVRATAIDKLAKSKEADPAELSTLERAARTDAMNDARLSAIAALAGIEYADREPFLRSLLADRDPVVRRVAADLIEEKLKKPRPQFTPLPVDRPLSDYETVADWARSPHSATIRTARGDIALALLSQEAPMTAWNFAELARKHFFDGMTFMRVVPNFVIQGGDPRNDMSGGPGYAIRDEINMQKYTRGAVGMALSGPDTGGSQFFVTHSPQPHLDGGYTIFARVTDGMTGVVDQIERGDRVEAILIDGK